MQWVGGPPSRDGSGKIVVGKSRWFSVRLTEQCAPWAYVKGVPARAISTLELLATTLGLVLLAPPELNAPGVAGTVVVTGLTDSQVSAAVVSRGLTTAFPLCAVGMELSAQLEARGAELFLDWVPRGENKEADRLADGDWTGFDPSLRVHANLEQVRWLVLDDLLASGRKFYEGAARTSVADKRASIARSSFKRKKAKLRETDPW